MNHANQEILNPLGATTARHAGNVLAKGRQKKKQTIGLLNNSKPNVAFFLEALEREIKAQGYNTVNVTKPRSAGPCPDIDLLAKRCDYVINAVAD